jgi:TrmH family RNA methyltransferase
MVVLRSKSNDALKLYKKLATERKYRLREGLFAIEGFRVIDEARRSGIEFHAVFITEELYRAHADMFLSFPKVCAISDELSRYLSEAESPQGIFAVCKMPVRGGLALTRGGRYILMYRLQDPGNVGAIIRTADAFGVDGVVTVDCCDVYAPKVLRSAAGGVFKANVRDMDLDEAMSAFRENGIKTFASVTDGGAAAIEDCDFSGAAVLLGNEGNGLPEDVVSLCGEAFTIRLRAGSQSLNAAVAAGIIMYNMRRFSD